MLESFIPDPRLVEVDHADVPVPPGRAYETLRGLDFGSSPLVRALFAIRTLPQRLAGDAGELALTVDAITAPGTGWVLLHDEPGVAFAVGAVGKFWEPSVPVLHVSREEFPTYETPGAAKLAWAVQFVPRGDEGTRIVLSLRVTASDDETWATFRRYFAVVGPFSHFIRRHVLAMMRRLLSDPALDGEQRALPGDELIAEPKGQATHGIDIEATPEEIWPWLVQMGCQHGGWYSYDRLDNAGRPSADEVVPEWQDLAVGDVLAATPEGDAGFTVRQLEPNRALVLGVTVDMETRRTVPVGSPSPDRFYNASWAFVLEPLGEHKTRLYVRGRLDFAGAGLRPLWIRPVHHLMQTKQLRGLKARAEGRHHPHDSWSDVGEGFVGALGILASLLSPFLRKRRSHWGLTAAEAERTLPGDDRVPQPRVGWTHAITIDASAADVWPWVAQIGQAKGGFYSYQWLENLVGCNIQNADAVEPKWQNLELGDGIRLYEGAPALPIVELEPGDYFVVYAGPGEDDGLEGGPAFAFSWLFLVEPIVDDSGAQRCRFISRVRSTHGDSLKERLAFGPLLMEPIGFVMDRRMLIGVKERAEERARQHGVREAPGSARPRA